MKATVAMTEEERIRVHNILVFLYYRLVGVDINKLFLGFRRSSYRAPYTFYGEVSDELINRLGRMPTCEEIIMIVDSGFSRFGASCTLNGRYFYGQVS